MSTQTTALQAHDQQMALELKQLLSPEKALHLLHLLVERNPTLWLDIRDTLHPEQSSTDAISTVLRNLRALQLTQLSTDTLSVMTRFLSLSSCLRLSETCSFFNHFVPKHIDVIHVVSDPSPSMRRFFAKCERLRTLSIDGAWKSVRSIPFALPLSRCKSLRELSLINVRLTADTKAAAFAGGRFRLRDLELNSCSNLDVEAWTQLSSRRHAPDLRSVAIKTRHSLDIDMDDEVDGEGEPRADDSLMRFISRLVASPNHNHITNLALTVSSSDLSVATSLRRNRGMMANLKRLQLGLLDRDSLHRSVQNIAALFRTLLCRDDYTDPSGGEELVFSRLEMLSIDFCPTAHSGGFNDVSPSDLRRMSRDLPRLFPKLRLLALYGSHSSLLFNEAHLDGFLSGGAGCLRQIIDLSLGFEGLAPRHQFGEALRGILESCPELAWLTLESEQLLSEHGSRDHEALHHVVADATRGDDLGGLKWITMCSAEQDRIYPISSDNAVNIEYWDRSIEHCDFEAALSRSAQIVSERGQ